MTRQTSSILLLIILMTILMGVQCREDYIEPPKQRFLETVDLTPAQKVYSVNDTIWLKYFTSSKTFLDTISGQRLPTNTIKFGFGASLSPKYNTPINPPGGFCNFILPNNTTSQYVTSQSGTSTYFSVDCDNASAYNIQLGVVLKYKGIYVLNLPGGISLEPCTSQTNPYPSARVQFTYNLSDCNKDIYLSIPDSARKEFPVGITATQIDYKVAYAFKVQ